jgi:hypothetical protein
MLDKIWTYQKSLKEERYKQDKLIFEHYRNMEYRYHTWMNYYSLFNGALLVAYYGILVNAGKIVEMESHVSDTATVYNPVLQYSLLKGFLLSSQHVSDQDFLFSLGK